VTSKIRFCRAFRYKSGICYGDAKERDYREKKEIKSEEERIREEVLRDFILYYISVLRRLKMSDQIRRG